MGRRDARWRLVFAAAALAIGVFAAASGVAADDDDDEAPNRFPQPVLVGALLHRTVLEPLESQPILGHVREIVRAADGSIKVIVDYGGFLGFDTRPIGVPLEAMALLGEYMEILDFKPAQLDGFPAFDAAGTQALAPTEVIEVGLAKPSH